MQQFKFFKRISIVAGVLLIAASALRFTATSEDYFDISKNLDIFTTLYKELNVYYVDDTKPGELMKTGIDAMLESLDPYTVYYPESEIEDFRFMTTGQYGGIGALIRKRGDYVVISEPYENMPAQKAGVLAGDKILKVDGKDAKGKNSSEMSQILRGQPNTTLVLTVERPGEENPLDIEITREKVKINDVPFYGEVSPGVGYIKLTGFTETASKEVKEAFTALKTENNINSLVLDLRGNGGGLLREAVNIVNLFVPKGQEVVFTKGKVKDWDKSHRTMNAPMDLDIPLVVLIDRGSASASEIVAGTLQDLDRAVVVGENSFGKGLVQQTRNLSYNTKLKVTVAKYYTPSGRCIQRLDYSHKDEDGRAEEIPDSLRTEYKTKNGRKVLDGAGIEPDKHVEDEEVGLITATLMQKSLIFDYATEYARNHESIAAPEDFKLTEKEYEEFKAWLSEQEYEYTTRAERMLKKLEEATEDEKYADAIADEFKALEKAMHKSKEKDVETYKEQILVLLENEIISRYYFQEGRIRNTLADDRDLNAGIQILKDSGTYNGVLAGEIVLDEEQN
jgi:carboxyl-terminal processing protease